MLAFIAGCFAREREAIVATVWRSANPQLPVGGWLGLEAGTVQGTLSNPRVLAEARALAASGAAERRTVTLTSGAAELLLEPITPPPHLFLMGSGPDAGPLAAFAAALGWTTTISDPRARFDTLARSRAADHLRSGPASAVAPAVDRAARPVAMVMSHDFDRDREALAALLPTRARYIGVLGPRHRTEQLAAELGGGLERLHAPAGLAIGAETPAEIALSGDRRDPDRAGGRGGRSPQGSSRGHSSPCAAAAARRGRVVLTIGCAILAAGAARRFGEPKQLAVVSGKPLVRRVAAAACRSACARVAVVSGAHDLTRALGGLPVERLDNRRWASGMASSIHVAVGWAETCALDALLIAVADQPRLDVAHLDRLIAASIGGRVLAASAYADVLGVPALFPRALLHRPRDADR